MGTSRRDSLALLAAGTLGAGWCDTSQALAEPPPETTRIRLNKIRSICLAPAYVAEALLRAEGFTDVQYIGDGPTGWSISA
jgi:NitT/TauT family transport system substrate-binding protein